MICQFVNNWDQDLVCGQQFAQSSRRHARILFECGATNTRIVDPSKYARSGFDKVSTWSNCSTPTCLFCSDSGGNFMTLKSWFDFIFDIMAFCFCVRLVKTDPWASRQLHWWSKEEEWPDTSCKTSNYLIFKQLCYCTFRRALWISKLSAGNLHPTDSSRQNCLVKAYDRLAKA